MRTKRRTRDDDEKAFNDAFDARTGALKPGITRITVPMRAMDAASVTKVRVVDSAAKHYGQPGFATKDATASVRDATARNRIYDAYDAEAALEWSKSPTAQGLLFGARPGAVCTVKFGAGKYGVEGSPGHLRRIGNELICVSDASAVDGMDRQLCDACKGAGMLFGKDCETCDGTGFVDTDPNNNHGPNNGGGDTEQAYAEYDQSVRDAWRLK
jgi:hypothetical protein